MTYISILPKNENAQSRMTDNRDEVMDLLFAAAKDILQIPDTDIIVELNRCTTVSFNRAAVHAGAAPDVVLKFATSDQYLQPRFQTLCDRVVDGWNSQFGDIKLEVWVSLIDTWGTNADL
ncbi:hypothetical protein [Arthrobacter sp. EpRS71]|uniref:hypothetical protein n=1 Tax=Arthrobacter sp. EpRS71 TaxID=1743141 RepID=UPI0012E39539|nr:hypothetical protein [Arthrobacter sp. EpRS71]